jgi:hypothetical protein
VASPAVLEAVGGIVAGDFPQRPIGNANRLQGGKERAPGDREGRGKRKEPVIIRFDEEAIRKVDTASVQAWVVHGGTCSYISNRELPE